MDAVHRSKTLKIVVVTVQDQLHAILPCDGQKQALKFKPVIGAVVRIEAMQPAVVDRDVEEKDFPRLARRGEVVGQPAVLGGAIIMSFRATPRACRMIRRRRTQSPAARLLSRSDR